MTEKEAYEKGLVRFKDHRDVRALRLKLGRFPTYEEAVRFNLIECVITEEELWDEYSRGNYMLRDYKELLAIETPVTDDDFRPFIAGVASIRNFPPRPLNFAKNRSNNEI